MNWHSTYPSYKSDLQDRNGHPIRSTAKGGHRIRHDSGSYKKIPLSENRLFFIFLLMSVVLLFISGSIKLRLLTYPRAILLAPLNISLRYFNNISTLRQENLNLKGLLARLQIENAALKETIRHRGGEFNLAEITLLKAQIVGRDQMTLGSYLVLDRGESAGVKINMPVITEMGVVGKVIQTTPFQSLVETILAKDSKIAGMDQRSRVVGVVSIDRGNRLKLNYVTPDADIQVGDTIISSGLGGVFPKGLLIGQVIKALGRSQVNGLFNEILLKPFVDIYQIETVYIITETGVKSEPPIPKRQTEPKEIKTDWEKTLERLRIEPPLEIKIR